MFACSGVQSSGSARGNELSELSVAVVQKRMVGELRPVLTVLLMSVDRFRYVRLRFVQGPAVEAIRSGTLLVEQAAPEALDSDAYIRRRVRRSPAKITQGRASFVVFVCQAGSRPTFSATRCDALFAGSMIAIR